MGDHLRQPKQQAPRKLAKLLEGYGERLQWSVFECRLQLGRPVQITHWEDKAI